MIGTTLDEKYRIERLLGEGGMGAVYAAEDVRSGDQVAVKVMHAELTARAPDTLARFEREARAAGGVDTEHIVRCLDAGTDPATRQPYMVLELLAGEDFQRVLRRTGPVSPDLALRVTAQTARGLARAHEAGIVHRDIKPANLFLAQRAGREGERVVKILDFGVAKILKDPSEQGADNDGLTRTGSMLGSPLYMSPEQARSVKTVDRRADVWSLGVVLYKALAGRTPFDHISSLGDLVLALWNEPPPPVQQFAPWVGPDIAAVLDRMLRVEPDERFQSMAEVLDALAPLLPGGTEILDAMLAPLAEDARQRTAATFFRRFDTRARPLTNPMPPRVPTGAPPTASSETSSPDAPAARPDSPSGIGAVSATTGPSAARGPVTQSGLATTDPGSVTAAPPRRMGLAVAIALTLVGLGAGVGTAFLLMPGSGAGPAASTTAPAETAATSAPTVTPAPDPPSTAAAGAGPSASASASAAPEASASASAAPTTSAAPTASATAAAASTAPASAAVPPHAAPPRPTATASASAAPRPTSPTFTDFGDRK